MGKVAAFKLSGLKLCVKKGLVGELVWASAGGPGICGSVGDHCWGTGGCVGALLPQPHNEEFDWGGDAYSEGGLGVMGTSQDLSLEHLEAGPGGQANHVEDTR